MFGIAVAIGYSAEPPETPTFGAWKGFRPGSYVAEKKTYRGVSFRKDGEEYRRTVLISVSKAGAAGYYEYTAEKPDGPWIPGKTSHGDVSEQRKGVRVETKELPAESITVGSEVLPCQVVLTTISDDWGTRTRKQWVDQKSELDLKREETFEGQDPRGSRSTWSISRVTSAIKEVTIGGETLRCFVQQQRQSLGSGELRWEEVVNAKVPGRRVSSKYWEKNQQLPKVETELVAWGFAPELVADFEKRMPEMGIVTEKEIERRRTEGEAKRKRESNELEKKMGPTERAAQHSPARTRTREHDRRVAPGFGCRADWRRLTGPATKPGPPRDET